MNAISGDSANTVLDPLTIEKQSLSTGRSNLRSRTQAPAEWLELSYAVETLRVNHKPIVVQFLGAAPGVGTSTVASGFATAAGHAAIETMPVAGAPAVLPVLFINCNPIESNTRRKSGRAIQPESLVEAFRRDSLLLDTSVPTKDDTGVYSAWLGASDSTGAVYCNHLDMARLFEVLRGRFSLIVLDCPPVSKSFGALSLAPHCDGTLIVLRAAVTRASAVKAARERVERVGGQVIGTVFNRMSRKSSWFFGRRG